MHLFIRYSIQFHTTKFLVHCRDKTWNPNELRSYAICSKVPRHRLTCGRKNLILLPCFELKSKVRDPLSPIVLALVIDELLDLLDSNNAAFHIKKETSISCLTFAGDIPLLSDSKPALQSQLLRRSTFLTARGLLVNATTCRVLCLYRIPPSKQLMLT
ncbi:hypothetical protein M514_08691 [Trichuris suis]|uniref:Reverse transcriptase domain-containing protein n=1 Tax=Trichuris suis TaxID=68888 RepID=A0A085MYQ6_9BILA|nr:hypothetical protein M513_08691 [Trichuris suis]KFD62352.1 hypothetical protein M514_08691 [Trichuris suis]